MPACVSWLIPSAVGQLEHSPAPDGEVPDDLLAALARVLDPRARRGVRHRLAVILGIGACAVLAGARSFVAIAEWAHDLTPAVRARLGIGRVAPSESAIRRTLQAVKPGALGRVLSDWLAARTRPDGSWRAIAVDGKTARGARIGDGRAVHLLAAFDHTDGVVLGQTVVDGKSNEITAFAPLLDGIDIAGVIVTRRRDAHPARATPSYLIGARRALPVD